MKRVQRSPFRARAPSGPVLRNVFVNLAGARKRAWLAGHYSEVIAEVIAEAKQQGAVQSVRLVINGRIQKVPLRANVAEWEQYMQHVVSISPAIRGLTGGFVVLINGFVARVQTRKRRKPATVKGRRYEKAATKKTARPAPAKSPRRWSQKAEILHPRDKRGRFVKRKSSRRRR